MVGTVETTCVHLSSFRVGKKEIDIPDMVFSSCPGNNVHLVMCDQRAVILEECCKGGGKKMVEE